ncbi:MULTISPECIES: hypothetical protein [Streptomyces]|uniref:Uncharacterized protein n=1 Tax=Streptomyces dengpaensis TaxID=2049881 RepID=A0ABM6SMD4_9ACTN|nr:MULTISPECIES: hypothetical protein [Streptomyces]AVH55832.1 hypothetical protein C4B68_08665 [Streptomyces dengpaensis]PIB12087.1 hypothetical protein B1C81_02600 [Streptomyces sp. HG99]
MIFLETDSDPAEWLLMPLVWDSVDDRQKWAQTNADMLWRLREKRPKRREVRALAQRLDMLAEGIPGRVPAHQVFLYAPDPRRIPLAFYALTVPSEGDRTASLREAVQADQESPVRPVEVDTFTTERLGEGLRSLRYWGSREGSLMMSLNFAWRSEQFGVDLSLRTVADDPGWLAAHLDEVDDFARSLWLAVPPDRP